MFPNQSLKNVESPYYTLFSLTWAVMSYLEFLL